MAEFPLPIQDSYRKTTCRKSRRSDTLKAAIDGLVAEPPTGVCSQNRITFDSDVKLALRRRCGRREYCLASPRTSRAGVACWRDQRLPRVAAFATLVTLQQVDCGPCESISNAV